MCSLVCTHRRLQNVYADDVINICTVQKRTKQLADEASIDHNPQTIWSYMSKVEVWASW